MSVNDILLCIFLCLLIVLVIMLINSLLDDMGGLSAILRSGKKKEAKKTKVVNGVDLNDISLDCVVNIDAVENHIDSILSRIKHELSCYEKDMRDKLPTNIYLYDVTAYLHNDIDELLKYMELFSRLSKTSKTEIEKE